MKPFIQKIILGFLLLLVVYTILLFIPISPNPGKKVLSADSTRIAHRCGRAIYPENTIFACRKITEQGLVDFLEMDFHLTKDDVAVVIHDDTLDRTTNGKGKISDYSYSELQTFDAGYHFSADSGATFPYRNKNVKIDKLESYFQNFPNYKFLIEVKPNSNKAADILLDLIRKYNMGERVLVGSFHQSVKDYLRSKNPSLGFYASTKEVIIWTLLEKIGLSHLYNIPSDALAVPKNMSILKVNESFVRSAKKQNLKILVWTINDQTDMVELLNMGVDGIMTDDPKLLDSIYHNLKNGSPAN
ncbi:glycerophosphodiester phosphodiesterase [Leptospira sp. GIMC2001]|uniref:glycerophosphodiester phosphodiesterase n=1 Tax=Leptospira sp. GIMC2001 TaxID=1513297 RepID=UPI00234BC74C|nr:glycerophosphodiester phosphodiesterase [Leptospira sp. GIMC2001]WCL47557.1 glycerophosphodiester phosphodiesterase [Leptospira sp. GIMC2001]